MTSTALVTMHVIINIKYMKYLIGFLVAVVLFLGGVVARPIMAEWIQPLAWAPVVADLKIHKDTAGQVQRFEWFGDVCYVINGYTNTNAISCLKK